MAARSARLTNNSVASLDEQSSVLSEVLGRSDIDSLSKISEKEKKKLIKKKKELELAKSLELEAKKGKAASAQGQKPSATVTTGLITPTTTSGPAAALGSAAAALGAPVHDDTVDSDLEEGSFQGGINWAQMQAAQLRAQAQAQAQAFQMGPFGNFVPNFSFGLGAPPQWGFDWSQMNERVGAHAMSDVDSDSEIIVVQPIGENEPDPEPPTQVKASGLLADFFKEQLVQVKDSDKVAPRLDEEVAVVVNKILSESVYVTEMDKLAKSYPRVENVEYMKVPKLDTEIYEAIDQKVRNFDQSLQNIQKAIMAAVSAIAPTLRLVYNRQESDQELNGLGRQLGESVKLLGFASNNLSAKRRELIKPCLAPTYAKTLSKGHDSSPDWLFGGDLVSTTKKCEVSQKIGEKVLKRKAETLQGKSQPTKKFRGKKGPPMLRGYNPYHMQGMRFPGPQMMSPYQMYSQQSMGFPMGFQRPYRPRQPFQNQGNQGFPKKQNTPK